MFGENFTSKDLMETQVNIGDVFQLDLQKLLQHNQECDVISLDSDLVAWILSKIF